MADPMWSGGAEQFQDRYPYVWFIMGEFNRGPFYPTDPPRDPGAFYDSVAPMLDFPVLGTAYAPFVSQYAIYYAEQWTLNPPATSTSVGNAPAQDDDTSLALKIDLLTSSVLSLHTKLGTFVETDTTASLLYFLSQQVTGLPGPITGYATGTDSARILAALYYIAQAVIVPVWTIDNEEVITALGAMMTSITEQHGEITTDTGAIISDVSSLSLQASGSHDILAAKSDDIRAVEDDIIAAIGGLVEPIGGATGYPGLDGVTFASAVPWTGPQQITATMDGCLVEFTSMPAGTGHNDIGAFTNWQHAGWLAFLDDQGYADEVQWLGMEKANYCPKRMASASAVLVFPRVNSGGTLTPWTRNP